MLARFKFNVFIMDEEANLAKKIAPAVTKFTILMDDGQHMIVIAHPGELVRSGEGILNSRTQCLGNYLQISKCDAKAACA
jgi:3-phosphoglycerate kinase